MGLAAYYLTVERLSALLEAGELTAAELMKSLLERTDALDEGLRAFIAYDGEEALRQAEESDRRRKEGKSLGPLDGIPVAIKDFISVRGWPLSCGSRMLEGYVSPYDAWVIDRLRAVGAVLWGRTNLDEFAMGSSTETSAFGPTANPWDRRFVPGGSSGGSACAVAAGLAPLALGTDTGGSVRQPAAFCGIVGLKPTYGRVSRYGVTAFASSLDQVGPFGRSVWDVATLLGAIAGRDPHDSTSVPLPVPDYANALGGQRNWNIGISEQFFAAGLNDEVKSAVRRAIDFFENAGCPIRSVSFPNLDICIGDYYVIATAEAFSNLSRFDGVRYGHRAAGVRDVGELYARSRGEGFGAEVKRRILLGAFVLSGGYHEAYYGRAQRVRTLIRRSFEEIFQSVDFLLTPTAPTVAFPLDDRGHKDPLAMYLSDVYTVPVTLAGLPAISLPCGFSREGLPIGLQLIGTPYRESDLLAAAHFFERSHDFYDRHPTLTSAR
ncbi:MAG: Asp-tRNA(Asn)/Glu-tRNA(Gln) amidotransferase subunit GatA [Puniceicoccales bacterium]|jgi:aspartyl-tRNA(Asn)/glutamyl-tRNA(Gln) amidotransferase subunit A|nr:Asp-tRNA(Asn)/Glu-tRNA(Gln) amidotransferase subunit GatA [Puniceicoccales bacterium]